LLYGGISIYFSQRSAQFDNLLFKNNQILDIVSVTYTTLIYQSAGINMNDITVFGDTQGKAVLIYSSYQISLNNLKINNCENAYFIVENGDFVGQTITRITNSVFDNNFVGILASVGISQIGTTLTSIASITLENVTVSNSQSQGFSIRDFRSLTVSNCLFYNNFGFQSGGAIYIAMKSPSSSVIIRNCIFDSNEAVVTGGALNLQALNGVIEDTIFLNNKAFYGGAIQLLDLSQGYSSVKFKNVSAYNNVAKQGGFLFVWVGNYEIEDSTFSNNFAKARGGVIADLSGASSCANEDLNPYANINYGNIFESNDAYLGGAVFSTNCAFKMDGNNYNTNNSDEYIVFSNNKAVGLGGAMFLDFSVTETQINNVKFISNYAEQSYGGLGISGGIVNINNCIFDNNIANTIKFGAFGLQIVGTNNLDDIQISIQKCQFINNEAPTGGGIGMEIISDNIDYKNFISPLLTVENTIIKHNTATLCGGGLGLISGYVSTMNSTIYNNSAFCGAGLFVENGVYNDLDSEFSMNIANQNGGGIHMNSKFIKLDKTMINSNTASLNGGGIYSTKCPNNNTTNITLSNNIAGLNGGGIYIDSSNECDSLCDESNECILNENSAAFGADLSSTVSELMIVCDISDTLSFIDTIFCSTKLLDNNGETMLIYDETYVRMDFTINDNEFGITESDFDSEGDFEVQFDTNTGIGLLKFELVPNKDINSTVFELSLQFTVIAFNNENDFRLTKTVDGIYTFKNEIYKLPPSIVYLGHVLNAIGLILIVVSGLLVYKYKMKQVIRGARIPFLLVILFGLALLSISMSIFVMVPYKLRCEVYLWLLHISFILVVCPLLAKTWALYTIFKYARNLKKFVISGLRLFNTFVSIPLVLVFIFLIVWTSTQPMNVYYEINPNTNLLTEKCFVNPTYIMVSYILVSIALLSLCYVGYQSKDLPDDFRESIWLGLTAFSILILVICFIPLISLLDDNIILSRVLSLIVSFLILLSVLVFIFLVKFIMIKSPEFAKKIQLPNTSEASRKSSERTQTNERSEFEGVDSNIESMISGYNKNHEMDQTIDTREVDTFAQNHGNNTTSPQGPRVTELAPIPAIDINGNDDSFDENNNNNNNNFIHVNRPSQLEPVKSYSHMDSQSDNPPVTPKQIEPINSVETSL